MLTGRKLLLADDSLTIQKVVSLTFNDEKMEVTTVGSGAEAVEKLDERLPDIVLADVFMPEPNGYELCERIKRDERTRHIPVLLLVGTFEPFNEAEARRVGADEVLTKPFQSIRDLINKVGSLLGGSEEKNTRTDHERDERRSDEEETQGDSSSFAVAADPSDATSATTPADAFGDFDMDDATIQTTPATAFDTRAQHSTDFSEIKGEEQFSDRSETNEAFDLGDDLPVQPHAAIASASSASSSEASPVAGSAFAAHTARAAEADDALLELGDITPAREASDEADDFILDIGDEDAVDSSAAHERPVATEGRKSFAAPEVSKSPAPIAKTSPLMLAQEPKVAPEEVPQQLREESVADVSGFELERAPAAAAGAFAQSHAASSSSTLSPEMLDELVRRVVAHMSERVVREIAWDVVPDLAERFIKQRLEEEKTRTP